MEVDLFVDRSKNMVSVDFSYLVDAYAWYRTAIGTEYRRDNDLENFECFKQTKIDLKDGSKYLDEVERT